MPIDDMLLTAAPDLGSPVKLNSPSPVPISSCTAVTA